MSDGVHAAITAPAIDILIESALWRSEPEVEAVARRAIEEAARKASSAAGELAIVLTDDSAIRALNRKWRGRDEPTNVLSFPGGGPRAAALPHLGDIVIGFQTVAREASSEGKPVVHHLVHLLVHGYLHLLGYDHETEREAGVMEKLETEILAALGVPDPYRARG